MSAFSVHKISLATTSEIYKDEQFKLVDMSYLYFRQNAGAGMEELKVEGGSISMIVDVFIYCKYQTNEM